MKYSFELFSDYFALKTNVFANIDPRVKLVITASLILSVLFSEGFVWPSIVFVFCFTSMCFVKVPLRFMAVRMIAPMGIIAVIVLLRSFSVSGDPVFGINLGSLALVASREGVVLGLQTGAKVIGALSIVMFLSFVTPAYKIFMSLLWFKVPGLWVEVSMMMYRFIFSLLEHTSEVISAQRTRLGYIDMRKSLSSMGTLTGALMLQAIDQAEKTNQAMNLRCYNGQIPLEKLAPMRRLDLLLICISPCIVVSLFLLTERWPG